MLWPFVAAMEKTENYKLLGLLFCPMKTRNNRILPFEETPIMKQLTLSVQALILITSLALPLCGCASPYPLQQAILKGNTEQALKLVQKGEKLDQPDGRGVTPLMEASYKGQTEVATALLDHGVNVNACSVTQITPLMCAAEQGKLDCCHCC
jgi:ankyrin repeat protein